MVEEHIYQLADRLISLNEVVGCGITDQFSGTQVTELGDFTDVDHEIADLWGSLGQVIAQKLHQPLTNVMARGEICKIIIFPKSSRFICGKIARAETAWKIAARMEPLIKAMS